MTEKIEYFDTQMKEIRHKRAELQALEANYNRELVDWLKTLGLPENFSMIDVVRAVSERRLDA